MVLQVPLLARAYGRPAMGMPEARLINMFVEETPAGPNQDARLPRPALVSAYSLGSGPIRGQLYQPGVFSSAHFVISGTTAYLSDGTNVGTILGSGPVRMACSADQVVAVATDTGLAYLYEGSSFTQITDPDLPAVSDVTYLNGRFYFTQTDSDQIWWTEVTDAANVSGLSFATAEAKADPNVGTEVLGDEIYFFGANTVEPWGLTNDTDLPIEPALGRTFVKGCASRESIVSVDNSLYFLGHDGCVYRASGRPERVSDHGVEDRVRRCTSLADVTAFAAVVEGHSFYVINIPGQTSLALDVENTKLGWAEWQSYERTVFRGRNAILKGQVNYVGDDEDGTVWALTPDTYLDDDQPIVFLASAFIPNTSGRPIRCDNIVLQGARGVGLTTGQGSAPLVEMRWSDDQGKTWGRWRQASLGARGDYTKRPVWQRLGLIREPGRHLEFRMTDPVLSTMAGVLVNAERPHG